MKTGVKILRPSSPREETMQREISTHVQYFETLDDVRSLPLRSGNHFVVHSVTTPIHTECLPYRTAEIPPDYDLHNLLYARVSWTHLRFPRNDYVLSVVGGPGKYSVPGHHEAAFRFNTTKWPATFLGYSSMEICLWRHPNVPADHLASDAQSVWYEHNPFSTPLPFKWAKMGSWHRGVHHNVPIRLVQLIADDLAGWSM